MLSLAGNAHQWIEFIGGPFDGHAQRREPTFGQLPVDIVWLVCRDTFAQLDGADAPEQVKTTHSALTSVALYRLDPTGPDEVYRFSGAISASNFGELLGTHGRAN